MEQPENKNFKITKPFQSEYLDIDYMKKRLEIEKDLEIRTKIEKQIELLEDALKIYTLHSPKRDFGN